MTNGAKSHGKNLKYYCSDYYNVSVDKYGVKCRTSLRTMFWENIGWINKIDPYGWFQWCFKYCLGRRSEGDERQINGRKKIVSRFRGKLKMLVVNLMIIQFLLYWGYELTGKDFFINSTN